MSLKSDKEEEKSEEENRQSKQMTQICKVLKGKKQKQMVTNLYFMNIENIFVSKLGQVLTGKQEKSNAFDPNTMGLYCKLKGESKT